MASVLGLEAVSYFAGTIGAPVWTNPIGPIKDETINLEKALADVTDRRANGWRLQRGTLKEGSVDMQLIYDPTDADFIALSDHFFDDTQAIIAFMDGDATVAGTYYGVLAAWNVTGFSQPRQLEEAIIVDMSMVPDLEDGTAEPPRWHTATIV